MTWPALIDAYVVHLRNRGRRPRTRKQAAKILARFAAFCPGRGPGEVQLEDLLAFRQEQRGRCNERTQATLLGRVRACLRWAHRRGHLLLDPSAELRLERVPPSLGRVLTQRQVERLLSLPDPTRPRGLRDLAVLETFYGTGVRLAECRDLDLADLDLRTHLLEVREGKGGSGRRLPVGNHLAGVLAEYLEHSRPALASVPSEPALFLTRCQGRRLGDKALAQLVSKYAKKARLAPLSPHRLRHAYATHLLEGGADLRHIQALLGHRSILATELYTRLRPVELFRMVRRCHPRGRRKSPGPQLSL